MECAIPPPPPLTHDRRHHTLKKTADFADEYIIHTAAAYDDELWGWSGGGLAEVIVFSRCSVIARFVHDIIILYCNTGKKKKEEEKHEGYDKPIP